MGRACDSFVLIIVLLTENIAISNGATGDWTSPVISNFTRSGTLQQTIAENQPVSKQTSAFVAVEGATSYKLLSQSVDGLFALQTNGSINITSRLDYENATSYTIVVEATDGCIKTTATVTIKIEDKNDNAPVFPGDPYFIRLPDNSTEGTFVTKVMATDADRSFYLGHIGSYSIRPGKDNDSFFIVPASGEIFVTKDKILSSTVKVNYTFTVQAMDTGSPYRFGTADVTVCVTCPVMDNGGESVVSSVLLLAALCMFALY